MKARPTTRMMVLMMVTSAALLCTGFLVKFGQAQQPQNRTPPQIPKVWDDGAVAALELPLANAAFSPVQVPSEYYYHMPVRPIYKSYPVYVLGKEPPGYMDWLKQQEPEIVFDPAKLKTEADWVRAGELVFDAPILYEPVSSTQAHAREYYEKIGVPLAKDGTAPFKRYVVRNKGVIDLGNLSCANCHTRVMPDGTVVKGAQSNLSEGRGQAHNIRERAAQANDQGKEELARVRRAQHVNFGAPWIQPDPAEEFVHSLDQILASRDAIPPGVVFRQGTSIRYAVQVPDLIGVKDRRYLDHTGLERHQSVGDLMRYAALNQDTQLLARYHNFIPAGKDFRELPAPTTRSRYSDEQLYALALYLYSLKPPPNPNTLSALARRGQKVFQREGCAGCHTPPLYTNNMLTPVEGFKVPEEHRKKYEILPICVGTDPSLAVGTRRGTGYYKVPSLKGVWYRGPFLHNGSLVTLEDVFDPRRLREDYVPTGYKPSGVTTQAVKGHNFGLHILSDDKKALIAFLKTL